MVDLGVAVGVIFMAIVGIWDPYGETYALGSVECHPQV
jgi:hypothetical protein